MWFDACVVATYETTYASIIAVFACVTSGARASRCCVRRWRCAAAKKEHRKDKNRFHDNLQQRFYRRRRAVRLGERLGGTFSPSALGVAVKQNDLSRSSAGLTEVNFAEDGYLIATVNASRR